jgi:hypothetical protein
MTNRYFRFMVAVFLCYGGIATAQSKTAFQPGDAALQNAVQFFNTEIKDQSRLYNGREYNFFVGYEGIAYFPTRTFDNSGSIVFDGVSYENVPLMLDVFKQKVITLLPDQSTKISLSNEKIERFKLYGHQFINTEIVVTNDHNEMIASFFDQLYVGKSKVYVRRAKILQEISTTQTTKRHFIDKNSYFVEREGKFYRFSSARNLLSFFSDKKKEIQRHLREQNVQYKEDPERVMVLIATYYDSLN